MSDDLLSSIVDATEGGGPAQPGPPAGGGSLDALIRQVAATGTRARAAAATAVPALPPAAWQVVARYLDADDLLAVLARAEPGLARGLVGALDDAGRAWLGAQGDAMALVDGERHRAALGRLAALIRRLAGEGRLDRAASQAGGAAPAAPAPAPAPLADGLGFATRMQVGPAEPAATAPADPTSAADADVGGLSFPAADGAPDPGLAATDRDLIDALAAVVGAARGAPAGNLLAIAEASPHPLLAHGLRLVASGATAHDLDAAMGAAADAWLAARAAEAAQVRAAVLAIRFGDGPEDFRIRAGGGRS